MWVLIGKECEKLDIMQIIITELTAILKVFTSTQMTAMN